MPSSGGGSGGSTIQTTTQSNTPFNSSYLNYGFDQAKNLYQQGTPQYFPGSTVVPFSNQTQQALNQTENLANQSSPIISGAQNNLGATLNGDFLSGGNPYFSQMMDKIGGDVRQRMDSQFAGAGRYGSGAHANATADALTQAAGTLGYQNYADERSKQMQAQALAPSAYSLGFAPAQQLANVGAAYEGQASSNLQDQINRYNFNQQAPYDNLSRYMAMVAGGNAGGQTVTQAPLYRNQASSALGGALGGAALGQMTGLGAGYGAIGGGLLGLLG